MRILLTGGHLTPALALIPELKKQNFEICFVGRINAMENDSALSEEYKEIAKLNIPFYKISTGRLQRAITQHTIKSLLKIPLGLFQAYKIISEVKPDCVLSFGGYLALPICIGAIIKGIPIVTHEQTVTSGLSNRLISKISNLVIVSYKESLNHFPQSKTILIGNPLREKIFNIDQNLFSKKNPVIYITGGNQGSHVINIAVKNILNELLKKFLVIHQTGSGKNLADFNLLQKVRNNLPKTLQDRYFLYPYIDSEKIGSVLNNADLIVSRSGANTVSETLALKKPAIFVPLPFAGNREQLKNAQKLKDFGVAVILPQEELKEKLLETVFDVMNNIDEYKKNYNKVTISYNRNTPKIIVSEIKKILNDKEKKPKRT